MWKLEINSSNNQEFVVRKSDGKLLGTHHAQQGIVPMKWERKYNTPNFIKNVVNSVWCKQLDIENLHN